MGKTGRKKGAESKPKRAGAKPWTPEEHALFVIGLEICGRGDWRGIAIQYVRSRNASQVASHGQKYYPRQAVLAPGGEKEVAASTRDPDSDNWSPLDVNMVDILRSRDATPGSPLASLWERLCKHVASAEYAAMAPESRNAAMLAQDKSGNSASSKSYPWSRTEHALFLLAEKEFPEGDWGAMTAFLKFRTPKQIKTHARKFAVQSKARAERRKNDKAKGSGGKRASKLRRSVFDTDWTSLCHEEGTSDFELLKEKFLTLVDRPDDMPDPIEFAKVADRSKYSSTLATLKTHSVHTLSFANVPSSMPLPTFINFQPDNLMPVPFLVSRDFTHLYSSSSSSAFSIQVPPPTSSQLPMERSLPPPMAMDMSKPMLAVPKLATETRLDMRDLKRKRDTRDNARYRAEEDLLLSLAKRAKPLTPSSILSRVGSVETTTTTTTATTATTTRTTTANMAITPGSGRAGPAVPGGGPSVEAAAAETILTVGGSPGRSGGASGRPRGRRRRIRTGSRGSMSRSNSVSQPDISLGISASSTVFSEVTREALNNSSEMSLGRVPLNASRTMHLSNMSLSVTSLASAQLPNGLPESWALSSSSVKSLQK